MGQAPVYERIYQNRLDYDKLMQEVRINQIGPELDVMQLKIAKLERTNAKILEELKKFNVTVSEEL